MSIRRTFWIILVLLVVVFITAYLVPRVFIPPNPDNIIRIFTRLIALALGLMGLAWIWARLALSGVSLRRDARVLRQQVGQIFEERFRINNYWILARLWLEIRDQSKLPGNFGSRVLALVGPRQQRSYAAYTLLNRRGAFHLGPTLLRSGDPFGLFQVTRRFQGEQELLVLPYVVDLLRFPSPSGQFPGGKAILRRATDVTPQAAGVREYLPGDALRSIHWPTSVRKDRLMVKEFEQDPQADVWIFLDAHQLVHVHADSQPAGERVDQFWQIWKDEGSRVRLPDDTFEYAISAAGSIASYYLKGGRSVGLVSAGEVMTVLPPERGERQLNKILENLAFLTCNGDLPLVALVEAEAPQIPRASTVVLITPSVDPGVDVAIDALLMRSMKPILVHVDAESFGGLPGAVEFVEMSRRRLIPVAALRKGDDLQSALENGR